MATNYDKIKKLIDSGIKVEFYGEGRGFEAIWTDPKTGKNISKKVDEYDADQLEKHQQSLSSNKKSPKVKKSPDEKVMEEVKKVAEAPKVEKKPNPRKAPKEPGMALNDDINKFMDMYDEYEAENVVKRAKSDVEFPRAGKSPVNKMVNTKDKSRLLDYSKVRAEEKLAGITPPKPPKPPKSKPVDFKMPENVPVKTGPMGISVSKNIPEIELPFKPSGKPPVEGFETTIQKVGKPIGRGLGKALGHAKVAAIDMLTSPEETVSAEDELDAITENEMHDAEARQFAKTKAIHAGKKKQPIAMDLPKTPKQKESNLEKDVGEVAKKTLSPRKKTTVLWKKGDSESEYEVDSPEDMSDEEIIAIIKRQMMKDE